MASGRNDDQAEAARTAALRLLSHRSRSAAEMRSRLAQKGLDEQTIRAETDRLIRAGLLDDQAFARELGGSLARRGYGPRGISVRLRAKGLDEPVAATAIAEVVDEAGGELEMARKVVARRFGDLADAPREDRAKAASYLLRRGFGSSAAGTACHLRADYEV